MYFINKGVVVVCSEDERTIYNVLADGSFFGEYALLFSQKRTASVKSSTYCDLFVLTQEDFKQVLNDFPEFEETMRKEGKSFYIMNNEYKNILIGIKRVIEKIEIFKNFGPEFRDTLVKLLKPQTFSPGKY